MKEKGSKEVVPPKLFVNFLRWFCHPDLHRFIEGDLMELYEQKLKEGGKKRADRDFIWNVILLFRPGIIRPAEGIRQVNTYGIFKSYFVIGWRNLMKQRMYSLIKIGGFALGIAACLLITLFIRDELSYDTHYANSDRIYRVVQVYKGSGEIEKAVWFQRPFAQALKNDYPEMEKVGTYNSGELFGAGPNQIRRDDQLENSYEENFAYVDQELLEILQVRMVYGSLAHSLDEPHTMMITRSKAEKYFAGENPVGKLMVLNNDVAKPYKIGGVMEDFPVNSHLHFDFMITLTGREFWPGELNDWRANNYPTYLRLSNNADAAQLAIKMGKVIEKYLLPGWLEEGMPDARDVVSKLYFELQPIGPEVSGAGLVDGRQEVETVHDERVTVQWLVFAPCAGGGDVGLDQGIARIAHLVLLLAIAVSVELQVRGIERCRSGVEHPPPRRDAVVGDRRL